MANATSYHKVELESEHGEDFVSETGQYATLPWTESETHRWRGWVRILCEAVLVLTVLILGLRIGLADKRPRRGPNDPRKECKSHFVLERQIAGVVLW